MNDAIQEHPTGIVGALTTIVVIVARAAFHVDIDPIQAAAVIGAAVVIASAFTPRFRKN